MTVRAYQWIRDTPIGAAIFLLCLGALWLTLMLWLIGRDGPTTSVARYCEYGAVSASQLEGCKRHVTRAQIEAMPRSRHAVAYAQWRMTFCSHDAGPFCQDTSDAPSAADDSDVTGRGPGP